MPDWSQPFAISLAANEVQQVTDGSRESDLELHAGAVGCTVAIQYAAL